MPLNLAMYNLKVSTMLDQLYDLTIACQNLVRFLTVKTVFLTWLKAPILDSNVAIIIILISKGNPRPLQSARHGRPLSTHVVSGLLNLFGR